jgi:hypothetical protein
MIRRASRWTAYSGRMSPRLHGWISTVSALLLACGPQTDDGESASTAGMTGTTGTTDTSAPTSGASSGSEGGSETPTKAECVVDSDCVLINNCCQCNPAPIGAEVQPCEEACLQSTCDALGLFDVQVACRSGVCEFAEVSCADDPITCDEAMPSCGPEAENSVVDGCWGPCVAPRYCAEQACPADGCGPGWACVEHQAGPARCEVVPFECAGVLGCDCAAPFLAEFCAGGCSDDGLGALLCEDGG